MKFYSNRINTSSKVPTLSDMIKAAQTKRALDSESVVKTASTTAPAVKSTAKTVRKVEAKKEEEEKEFEFEVEVECEKEDKKEDKKACNDTKAKKEKKETNKKEEEKKANIKHVWVKVSKLTSEQKSFLREELEKFWTKKFVDALLAD